ncbi:LysR substrate-binding domain-containing protein [uncultured Pluralibacter sp.]|uniref:LysR substrate-binding domain-containing protein n=1 Tax=uncultured Pluralibacter sp. TaxID=1490864 RepID=UPI0026213911|nr:LysR substrate-binding domain-containing protein [uncultured Pluralibacter sp.]
MRFDVVDLTLFVNVAAEGSITGGARLSHLALASASERITNMETRAGTALLTRLPRGVSLTPAGEIVLRHARQMVAQHAQMRAELAAYLTGQRGTLKLYSNTSAASWLLPTRMAPWLAAHPDIPVDIEERTSADIVGLIAAGRAEAGLVSDSVESGSLTLTPVMDDNLVVIVGAGHALCTETQTAFENILNEPFVGLLADSALQQHIEGHARALGGELACRIRMRNFEGVFDMVAGGIGIAIVPHIQTRIYAGRFAVATLELSNRWARRRLCLCYRDESTLSPEMRGLMDWLGSGGGD